MISIISKDITTVDAGLIVHCVNCQHIMGSGVAKALYTKWPKVKQQYMERSNEAFSLGSVDFVDVGDGISRSQLYVANLYGQEYCGNDGKRYGDVDAVGNALTYIFEMAHHILVDLDTDAIHIPYLMSCDRAGLSWENEIFPIITNLSVTNPLIQVNICRID